MSEIAAWLEARGLGQLASIFERNDIDIDILCRMTDSDFKELGLSLGHRKKLSSVISADPLSAVSRNTSYPRLVNYPSSRDGERRQLTVMFCDLVESTALSARLDPEDLTYVLQSYQSCSAQFISRYGGTISKYMGDGILACFGYPSAHEDDAERAVHAALAIVTAVGQLRPHADLVLHVRIGIATGEVIVGAGGGMAEEGAIVGVTTNLAARLQSIAEQDAVVIADSTRKLIGGLFEVESLGGLNLKGFGRPTQGWRVRRQTSAESRFEAMHPSRVEPMVGRRHELELVLKRWEKAARGEGGAVVISGEPGVGKSRLVSSLRERLPADSYLRYSYWGSQHHQTSALYPVISQIERNAGIVREDSDDRKLTRLEDFIRDSEIPGRVETLAALLSIPTAERYPALRLNPRELKHRIFDTIVARLEELCKKRPVLLVVEDLQWIDPTSLELIERIVERIRSLPVLMIVTFRSGADCPKWIENDQNIHVSLDRLNRNDSIVLVRQLIGDSGLADDVVEQIISKADGVPLYHEELTKAVLQSDGLSQRERRSAALSVPASLHDSLMERLDRMSSVKQVAQLAATIGRTFGRDLLQAVCAHFDANVDGALVQLVDAGIVCREERAPELVYYFKHALLQDVAYQSLLREVRRRYHTDIAQTFAEQFPHIAEVQPELLAYHYGEGGQTAEAISYWKRAGRRATQRSANVEATAQFENALRLVQDLPDSDARAREEYELIMGLIPPLIATKGYSAPEVEHAFSNALRLADPLGGALQILPLMFSRYAYHLLTGQVAKAAASAEEMLAASQGQHDPELAPVGLRAVATCRFFLGDSHGARKMLEDSIRAYDPERDRNSAFIYGHDHLAVGLGTLSLLLWHVGLVGDARERLRQAMVHARSLSHLNTLGVVYFYSAAFHALCRNEIEVKIFGNQLSMLGSEHKLPLWSAVGTYFSGWARAEENDDVLEGCALMQEGLLTLKRMKTGQYRPLFLSWLAAACVKGRQRERGLEALEEARALMDNGAERWTEAEYYRVRSELLMLGPDPQYVDAVECAKEALRIAQAQQSRSLEIRASTALARLWLNDRRSSEAGALLERILESSSQDLPARDLREARALLGELGPRNAPQDETLEKRVDGVARGTGAYEE